MNFVLDKFAYFRRSQLAVFLKVFSGGSVYYLKGYFDSCIAQKGYVGWYLIKPIKKHSAIEAFIQIDFGLGYEHECNYPLNCLNNKLSSSVVNFSNGIQNIRLVLKEDGVKSSQVALKFIPIFKFEAFIRVAFYLYRLNKLRDITATQILSEKWHQILKAGFFHIFSNLDKFFNYGDTEKPLGYQQWIKKNECFDPVTRNYITGRSFYFTPVFSIACKVSGNGNFLFETVDSLRQQIYVKWQLLVVYDTKTPFQEIEHLKSIFANDERIKFLAIQKVESTNIIGKIVSYMHGEYVAWVDPGDLLSPLALYYWVEAINTHKQMVVWYSDSDQIERDGKRHSPCFRSSWNKELFYSQNYIGNCYLFHLPTIKRYCDLNKLTKDAEQYDLLLHLLEHVPGKRIGHIPKVLCHNPGPEDRDVRSRTQRVKQQRKALTCHFQRLQRDVEIEPGLLPYTYQLKYSLPEMLPHVTLIVPTRDQVALLKKSIKSIMQKTNYPNYDVIIIDNGSVETETAAYFREIRENAKIKIVDFRKAFNFAAINNFGVRKTDAEIIGLINNDIEVISSDWLNELVSYAVQKEVGCVGPKLLYGNNTVQHAGVLCGVGNVAGHAHRYSKRNDPGYFGRLQSSQYFSAVTGACLLVRRSVWQEVGGMNEQLAVAYNDVDFCLRVKKAGYHNVYTPYAELYHHESLSRGPEDTIEKKERYKKEVAYMWENWKEELENDEFYNPNLSRLREDFSL